MISLCGTACCTNCPRLSECGGCKKADGRPFGGRCVAAEWVRTGGLENLERQKQQLIAEFNSLGVANLSVENLNLLSGRYVNLEYMLPNGTSVKLLEDDKVIWVTRLRFPAANDATALWAMRNIFWFANTAATVLIRKFFCIGKEITVRKKHNWDWSFIFLPPQISLWCCRRHCSF